MVLNQITGVLPTCPINAELFDNLKNIPLADESWGTPGDIDLLIGVNLFAEILLGGKISNSQGGPNALQTVFGYVVLGEAPVSLLSSSSYALCSFTSVEIEDLVKKFWEIENVDNQPLLSIDDKHCENFYTATTIRKPTGEYEVALPFKFESSSLGDSYENAKRRFAYLERKFLSQPILRDLYDDVIREYIDKSYLSEVKLIDVNERNYFIPHHAVVRQDKLTTKVRPVLDASSKSDTGVSLNDVLYAGPKSKWPIQPFIKNENISELPEVKSVTTLVFTTVEDPFLYKLAGNYSTWDKLVKIVVYIFKFAKKLPRGPVTIADRDFVENEIIKSVQSLHFSSDIENLQNNKKCSDTLIKLKPFLDNGLLRVGGRLDNSEELFEYKHPLLLPRKGHIVELIIKHYHEKKLSYGS